jgi:hypothetical protein
MIYIYIYIYTYIYMLNKFGESGQLFGNPLLIFIGRVNVASSFIFITFFSCIFITAVSNGLGIFISNCNTFNPD